MHTAYTAANYIYQARASTREVYIDLYLKPESHKSSQLHNSEYNIALNGIISNIPLWLFTPSSAAVWLRACRHYHRPKLHSARLDTTRHVRLCRASRAVLFDKLDTAKMHRLDTSNVARQSRTCRVVSRWAKWNLGRLWGSFGSIVTLGARLGV